MAAILIFAFIILAGSNAAARSAYSPRQSGTEPPGGPRPIEVLPGNSPSRTAEGGMGYVDAYGNTVRNMPPEEKKPKRRLAPGAYGGYGKQERRRDYVPEPLPASPPLWQFR